MKHSSRAAVAFAVTVLAAHGGQSRPGCPARGGFSPGAGQDRLRGSRRADFDDGPDPAATPRFLDALESLAVRATFFVLGQEVARHPRLAAQIAGRRHELAVHGWAHDRPWLPTPQRDARDLRRAATAVYDATGQIPRWYRPPYGS